MRPVIALALVVVLALQSLRTLFPLLFAFGEDVSYYLAAAVGVGSFATPILAWPVHRLLGPRLAAPVAVSALVVLRLALQLVHPIPLWLAITATAAALIALVFLAATLGSADGPRFVPVLVLGLAVDTAIRGAFLTWDVPWQEGIVPAIVTVLLGIGALAGAWTMLPRGIGTSRAVVRSTASLGVYLFLQVMFVQSPAFVASSAGLSLEGALTVVLLGDVLAILVVWWVGGRPISMGVGIVAGVGLAATAYALTQVSGPPIALLVLGGQALTTGLVTLAFDRPEADGSPSRMALGGALGGVALALLAAGYQIHYEIPLPFPNTVLPPVAGLLMGLAALGRSARVGREPARVAWRVAAVPIALLLIPLGLLLTRPARAVQPARSPSIRIVNYNIHQGLNPDGQVDPEATARTIEALAPDVVMLQEIGRGWPIHIFMDTGEWLSRRLDMPFVYQPAADRQFGNAIMTNLPLVEREGGFLPFGEGPQRRSYLRARLDVGDGRTITLIDVHLQHQEDKPETRRAQIEELLRVWRGEQRTVIAGDMNTQPDEDNLRLFLDAGLLSVQDEAGLGHLPTATQEVVRGDRVDYVFVTPDISFRDVAVPYSFASDHLPIAVTVFLP
jgi:endonuclease/exonuclease/phosphatase family metal-dependent hydrolase